MTRNTDSSTAGEPISQGETPRGAGGPGLLWGMILVVTAMSLYSLLDAELIRDGETYSTANIPIELALNNKLHYPLHGQAHFDPAIRTIATHPPLHYLFSGLLLKLTGIGRWQVQLAGVIVGILLSALVIFASMRWFGRSAALIAGALCVGFQGLYYSAQLGRPDLTLGLMFGVFLLLIHRSWFYESDEWVQQKLTVLVGLFAALGLCSHWNGAIAFVYLPVHVLLLSRLRVRGLLTYSAWIAVGLAAVIVPWAWFYGADFPIVFDTVFRQGAARGQLLAPQAWTRIFVPLTVWRGGTPVLVGLTLAALFAVLRQKDKLAHLLIHGTGEPSNDQSNPSRLASLAKSVQRWRAFHGSGQAPCAGVVLRLGDRDLMRTFMATNFLIYVGFYFVAIQNRHYQYLANIYVPMLLVSTSGWDDLLQRVCGALPQPERLARVAATVAVIVATCLQWATFETSNPLRLDPNGEYARIRSAFGRFVDRDYDVFMSVSAYIYLYDHKYTTNRAVEIATVQARVNEDYLTIGQKRRLATESGEIMIISNTGYMYENRFYDERVWRAGYRLVASISVRNFRTWHILYRNDVADSLLRTKGLVPKTTGIDHDVIWYVHDPREYETDSLSLVTTYRAMIEAVERSEPDIGVSIETQLVTNFPPADFLSLVVDSPSTTTRRVEGSRPLYLTSLRQPLPRYLDGREDAQRASLVAPDNNGGPGSLREDVDPLQIFGLRGRFELRESGYPEGTARLSARTSGEANETLILGFPVEGTRLAVASGGRHQYMVAVATMRAGLPTGSASLAVQERVGPDWDRSEIPIYRHGRDHSILREYALFKRLPANTAEAFGAIILEPGSRLDWLDVTRMSVYLITPESRN